MSTTEADLELCTVCGQAFKNLGAHMRKHANEPKDEEGGARSTSPDVPVIRRVRATRKGYYPEFHVIEGIRTKNLDFVLRKPGDVFDLIEYDITDTEFKRVKTRDGEIYVPQPKKGRPRVPADSGFNESWMEPVPDDTPLTRTSSQQSLTRYEQERILANTR